MLAHELLIKCGHGNDGIVNSVRCELLTRGHLRRTDVGIRCDAKEQPQPGSSINGNTIDRENAVNRATTKHDRICIVIRYQRPLEFRDVLISAFGWNSSGIWYDVLDVN